MKALVLHGGEGTRMRPLTHTGAKQLVPVANKPISWYVIEDLVEAGIKEIVVIVGSTAEEVKESLGDGSRWGVSFEYVYQEKPLGLAHTVKITEDLLRGSPFVMVLADNLIQGGIKKYLNDFLRKKPDASILLKEVENPSQFGVAEVKDRKIASLVEKPKRPKSNLAIMGIYFFTDSIFSAVNHIEPSWREELEITDAIQYLLDQGKTVIPHIHKGWWLDTGKKDDILLANLTVLKELLLGEIEGDVSSDSKIEGDVSVGVGTVIKNSKIRGPVIIGEKCVIENSYIGPYTSVGNKCKIRNAELEDSVLLEEAKVSFADGKSKKINGALIGRRAKVRSFLGKPKALYLFIGDDSEVDIP